MTSDEYVKTLVINGTTIKLGIDDYGQCYFAEWVGDDGELNSQSLGTYHSDYMGELYYLFEPEYARIHKKLFMGEELSEEENNKYEEFENQITREYMEGIV